MGLPFIRNTALLALACSVVSVQQVYAQTASLTIDAGKPPYDNISGAIGTTISDNIQARGGAMSALVGKYNSLHVLSPLKPGTIVQFKWIDGSSEKGQVVTPYSSDGVQPIPGTQQPAPSSNYGGSGGGGEYYDPETEFGTNDRPYSNCFSEPRTVTITIGGTYTESTTTTVLKCPGS